MDAAIAQAAQDTSSQVGSSILGGGLTATAVIAVKELLLKLIGRGGHSKVTRGEVHAIIDKNKKETEEKIAEKVDRLNTEKVDALKLENELLKHQMACTEKLRDKIDANHAMSIQKIDDLKEAFKSGLDRVHSRVDEALKKGGK
jgi:hypothetical protein